MDIHLDIQKGNFSFVLVAHFW